MPEPELLLPLAPIVALDVARVALELGVQIREVGEVRALGHVALLGQELEDAAGRLLDQLEAQRVVRERYVRVLDLLLSVLPITIASIRF